MAKAKSPKQTPAPKGARVVSKAPKPAGKKKVRGRAKRSATKSAPVIKRASGTRISASDFLALQRYVKAHEAGNEPPATDRDVAGRIFLPLPAQRRGPKRREDRGIGDKRTTRGVKIVLLVERLLSSGEVKSETRAIELAAAAIRASVPTVRREWLARRSLLPQMHTLHDEVASALASNPAFAAFLKFVFDNPGLADLPRFAMLRQLAKAEVYKRPKGRRPKYHFQHLSNKDTEILK